MDRKHCQSGRGSLRIIAAVLFLAIAASADAQEAQITLPSCSGSAVAKNEVCEVRLTASAAYANPYRNAAAQVSLVFSGPSGAAQRVQGFWEGSVEAGTGKTKMTVRFTPMSTGVWSYASTSQDPGLNNKTGSFTVIGSGRGFLRRNANRPEQFVFDNNVKMFMWGQTYYNLVSTARGGGPWKAAIDQSAASKLNKVRLLVFPFQKRDEAGECGAAQAPYPDSKPFTDANHTVLDIQHWRRLDEVVHHLNSKLMVADLIVFSTNCPSYSPLGNVEDERYLRYVLARYAAFPNVIWCLTNEWQFAPDGACSLPSPHPKSYWENLGNIVRNEDPWMNDSSGARQRPLSIHQRTQHTFDFLSSVWPTHAVLQDGVRNGRFEAPTFANGDEWGNYSIRKNLGSGMPVVNDEYGYLGEKGGAYDRDQHRRTIWGIALAGGYGSAGDARKDVVNGSAVECTQPYLSSVWKSAPEYGDLSRLQTYFPLVTDWWKLKSDISVSSSPRVYVMSEPGVRYLVYSATGGSLTLNLAQLPAGNTYKVSRYNPSSGSECALMNRAGGAQSFTLTSGDWVLRIETTGPALANCS